MKAIVVFLALLAAVKISYQEYLLRTATSEVIIHAYRDRAIAACQRDAKGLDIVPASSWARPEGVRLMIGKSNLDVYLWQTGHVLWNARFKNPYLFLDAAKGGDKAFCEFDIVHGAASVFRM